MAVPYHVFYAVPMKLLFATTNPHKFEEIQALLSPLEVTLLSLADVKVDIPEPEEDGTTLVENARIKACAYARASGVACLSDDSGLEVDALSGAPGVRSARYAGAPGSRELRDRKNREKLVAELAALGNVGRSARLVCTLCLADPDGRILFESQGAVEAEVLDAPRGEHGFGYDSLLLLRDVDKTAAELLPEEWNRISHRAKAAQEFIVWFIGR